MTQSVFFGLGGGLDQETPALSLPPGRVIACLNHESVAQGYARTQGYERIDGRSAPSAAIFSTLNFVSGSTAFVVGNILTGSISGATFRVLAAAIVDSGSFAGGTAAGLLAIHLVTGALQDGDILKLGAVTYGTVVGTPLIGDRLTNATSAGFHLQAVAYARAQITAAPGAGPVRGVLWFNGRLHAWRDNTLGTYAILHHTTASGWQQQDLGKLISFINGGPYEIKVGDTLKGDQSGATATVRYMAIDESGDWSTDNATGRMVLTPITGTIGDETVSVGANVATAFVGVAQVHSFPAGGRYEFDIFNFYGSSGTERAYGANGVGPGFEFDGDNVVPIVSGMPDDRPFLVKAHKYHLFFAFPKGSLQHSGLGAPLNFSALRGAAELGMGHEITSLVPNASSVLLVTTETSISALMGNDSSDWVLEGLSAEAGAKAHTAQRIGSVIYLDNRGLRRVNPGSVQGGGIPYGNFKGDTFTALIAPELEAKRRSGAVPVASTVVKSKDQYLLFFSDGTGISLFFGRKNPEPMLFEYPFVASCLHLAEVNGVERLFVGATDGFVYELNSGTSFDGAEIEAFVALPFGYQGSPRTLKRYMKAAFELTAGPASEITFLAQYDYGSSYQPLDEIRSATVTGGGGLWNLVTWGNFLWGAPSIVRTEIPIQGVGANMSLLVRSNSAVMDSYVLQGVTIIFSPRGTMR